MGDGGRRPGPDIGSIGEEYGGGGRGVETEIIEICRGGSILDGAAGCSSTSGTDTGAGSGSTSGSGSGSGSSTVSYI